MHFFAYVRPEALSGAQAGNVSGRTRGASLLRLQQGLSSRAVLPKRVEKTGGGLKARIGSDDLGLLDPNPLGDLLKVFLPQQVEPSVTVVLGHLGGRTRLFGVPVDTLHPRVSV